MVEMYGLSDSYEISPSVQPGVDIAMAELKIRTHGARFLSAAIRYNVQHRTGFAALEGTSDASTSRDVPKN